MTDANVQIWSNNIVDQLDIQKVSIQQRQHKSMSRNRKGSMITDGTDETTSSEVSEISEPSTRTVQFTNVSIREYNRIVGDHPDCKFGPPMALGWGYADQVEPINIDFYETIKPSTKRKGSMKLMSFARRKILHEEFCIPEKELYNPQREENMFEDCNSSSTKKKKGMMRSIRKSLGKMRKCVIPAAEESNTIKDFSTINSALQEEQEEDMVEASTSREGDLLKDKWVPTIPDSFGCEDTTDDDEDDLQSYDDEDEEETFDV